MPFYVDKFSLDSKEILRKRYSTLKNQPVFQVETRKYLHKNGSFVLAERAGTFIELGDRDYLLVSLRDVTTERRRQKELMQEVEFARRVQKELLPELEKYPWVNIRTIYHPSNSVSGDSYHMEWRNEGKILRGFLIDVTGHGLATALQTASINAMIRETSIAKVTLREQLRRIDLRAAKYFSEGSYAAMIGFELDFSTMELRYVGAGITQFYFNGKEIITPSMFVGMFEKAEFSTGAMLISEGDCIHFLTDGFTDKINQFENADFWSPDGKDFEADVAALEQLAKTGNLKDDATGLCFRINKK
jgi:serine phosphatase RsbU (regulator of sigma subunit)